MDSYDLRCKGVTYVYIAMRVDVFCYIMGMYMLVYMLIVNVSIHHSLCHCKAVHYTYKALYKDAYMYVLATHCT